MQYLERTINLDSLFAILTFLLQGQIKIFNISNSHAASISKIRPLLLFISLEWRKKYKADIRFPKMATQLYFKTVSNFKVCFEKKNIVVAVEAESNFCFFFHRKSTFSLKSHANVQFAEEDFGVWSDCTLIATPKKDHFWEKGLFKNHVGKFSETPFPVLGKFLWNRAFLCSKVVFGYLSTVSRGLCTAPRAANSIASSACISCTLSL